MESNNLNKLKNVKDLQYTNILNIQNITFVLLGTFFISVALTEETGALYPLSKSSILLIIIAAMALAIVFFKKKLQNVEKTILEL